MYVCVCLRICICRALVQMECYVLILTKLDATNARITTTTTTDVTRLVVGLHGRWEERRTGKMLQNLLHHTRLLFEYSHVPSGEQLGFQCVCVSSLVPADAFY